MIRPLPESSKGQTSREGGAQSHGSQRDGRVTEGAKKMSEVRTERRPIPVHRRSFRFPSRNRGFSFVELMMVLALAGLVMAVALPRLDFRRWRLNAATREVAGLLRSARQAAIRQQHDVIVTFNGAANLIAIHENADGDADGRVAEGERVYSRPLPEAVVFGPASAPPVRGRTGSPSSFQNGTLVFHSNGAASSSGVVYLVASGAEYETEYIRALWVERSTGSIQQLRLRDGVWEPL